MENLITHNSDFVLTNSGGFVCEGIFYFVDPDEDEWLAQLVPAKAAAGGEEEEEEDFAEPGAYYKGQAGARCCDGLLFPAVFGMQDPAAE